MGKKLSVLVLLILTASIAGLAFHHHSNGLPHDNCVYCFSGAHHSIFLISVSLALSFCLDAIFIHFIEPHAKIFPVEKLPFSVRAPPFQAFPG